MSQQTVCMMSDCGAYDDIFNATNLVFGLHAGNVLYLLL